MPTPAQRELFEAPLIPTLQRHVVDSLCDSARRRPLTPLYVVAPSAVLVEHLGRTCARVHGRVVHVRHLSWETLAAALTAAERRAEGRGRLTRAAAAWQARLFLAHERRPRGFFDGALGVRGFRSAMLRCFEELAAAGLCEADEVERFLVRHGTALRPRLRHVLELLLGFRRSFESQRDDGALLLARAARVPNGRVLATLQARQLWVYGFEQLEPLEHRLLRHLARDPELHVHVFVPHPSSRQTGLSGRLQEDGLVPAGSPELGTAAPVTTRFVSAPGEEAEAAEVARAVVHAVENGVACERVAVVARHAPALARVHHALHQAGVPCTLMSGTALVATRSGRAAVQLLELLETGLRPNAVLAFLLTAPLRWQDWCGIDSDPTPSAWERVAHAACLGHGLRDWLPKLRRVQQAAENEARARGEADEPTTREEATHRVAVELATIAQRLDRDLRRFPRRARWSEFVNAMHAFVHEAFVASPETRAVLEVLQRLRDLDGLGSPRPSRADFRDLARNVLVEARLPAASAARPGVWLGSAAELYGMDFDLVCVVGLQEGEWPGPLSEDPILPDADRRALSDALNDPHALRPSAARIEREQRLFRSAVQSARDALLLSFVRLDPSTAAARLPSTLLLELAEEREGKGLDYASLEQLSSFERVPLRRREAPAHGPILTLDEFDRVALAALPTRLQRRYVRALGPAAARGLVLDTMRNGRARFTAFDGWLHSEAVRTGLARNFAARVYSASQLATYITCPFRFFMRQVLRIEPLERDEHRDLSALEVGRLVHRVLERFYREQAGAAPRPRDAASGQPAGASSRPAARDPELERRTLLAAFDAVCAEVEQQGRQGARLAWEVRKRHLRDDLVRFLRAELRRHESEPGWTPRRFELRFGPGLPIELRIARGDRPPVALRGSIDRIDQHIEHDGLRVIDYKSGRLAFAGRNPQAVQLVLYLWAACAGDAERLRRSEARFVYVTRRGGFEVQVLSGAQVQARAPDLERLVGAVAAAVEGGRFFPQPGVNSVHCTVCDYRSVCDARVGYLAAMKSRAGQDAEHRELPDFGCDLTLHSPEGT